MALQVSAALVRLHSIDVIHRDISPRNILRSSADIWLLADFGISRVCTTTMAVHTSTAACNYDYCPPEQTEHGGRITDKSDVWALAATVLHAISGERPYGDAMIGVIIRAHMERRPPVVPETVLPVELSALLRECLSIDSHARPTPVIVHERLKAIRSQLEEQASGIPTLSASTVPVLATRPAPGTNNAMPLAPVVTEQPGQPKQPVKAPARSPSGRSGSGLRSCWPWGGGRSQSSAAAMLVTQRKATARDAADKV